MDANVGQCVMLMMKKREVPCIWPVPMLELDLEMLASTYGIEISWELNYQV